MMNFLNISWICVSVRLLLLCSQATSSGVHLMAGREQGFPIAEGLTLDARGRTLFTETNVYLKF